jgi:lantibiotic modifying enzyme
MNHLAPRDEIAAGADAIGDRLCRTAIWHGSLCNWFGRSSDELDEATQVVTPTVTALGGDLYEGSAGCGLFLAVLARRSGSAEHRRTAAAALQRSLAVADRLEP